MYEELKDKNFEIVGVAEDTAGESAAGPFYDAAKATFTTLIDTRHTVSSLFNLVNVPTGILIDEEGRIVRIDEGTYTRKYEAGSLSFGTDEYVPVVRDWVANGDRSRFVMDRGQIAARIGRPSSDQAKADAHFRLATYFQERGQAEPAAVHFHTAQQLAPDSWNYHRQEWSYTPSQAGTKWFAKFQQLGDRPYYAPMDLPQDAPEKP